MDAIDYAKTYRPAGSPIQEVNDPELSNSGVRLLVKRDDLIHQHVSGNKWRKLKYNLSQAVQDGHHTILTFGGAYSNHIAASSYACKKAGMESIGIIRGEDDATNPTLQFAREHGMHLEFVTRETYRVLTAEDASDNPFLQERFGRFFLVPEGGANGLGVRGCAEILTEVEEHFDVVCCAVGTATTLAGLSIALKEEQRLIGFPALKGGGFLMDDMGKLIAASRLRAPSGVQCQLNTDHHFGGYAKVKPELLRFISGFTERTGIPLDPIYTGKMMFGVYDLIVKGFFEKGTTILAIHTGGLQGWDGMRHRGLV